MSWVTLTLPDGHVIQQQVHAFNSTAPEAMAHGIQKLLAQSEARVDHERPEDVPPGTAFFTTLEVDV